MKTRLFLLLIAIFASTSTLFAQLQLEGTGTELDPYLIQTDNDLSSLSSWVKQGNTCANQYFKLTNSFTGNSVGDADHAFSEVFDGNNDTIYCRGNLFPKISNASIKNLVVVITNAYTISNNYYGGIIGQAMSSTISNCRTHGNISLSVAYQHNGTLSDWYCSRIGGIVAYASNCVIRNCGNYINISRSGYKSVVSSIAGIVAEGTASVYTSFNKGNITHTIQVPGHGDSNAMGIGGSSCYSCYNTGNVSMTIGDSGSSSSDGSGYARGINRGTVYNSYNIGQVTAKDLSYNTNMASAKSLGNTNNNCYNWQNVSPYENMHADLSDDFRADITPNINNGYPIFQYEIIRYTISANTSHGHVEGTGECDMGATVSLTVIPDEGYVFSHWSDGNTDNPRVVTANGDAQYTAIIRDESDSEFLMFMSKENGSTIGIASLSTQQTIEYSFDGVNWSNMSSALTFTLNSDEGIYMRGILSGNNTPTDYTQFSMTGSIAVYGNMNVLWNYANPNTPLKDYCGFILFKDCSALIAAPMLPATSLSGHCYQQMFQNCTSLIVPPELPATSLAPSCYLSMFQECTSLNSAPSLLADTLTDHCYWRMFLGCTALTSAPLILPAMKLTTHCYNQMFMQTAITTAPKLPATTLATNCYTSMFQGCSNLVSTPDLPATILASACYKDMFHDCINLSSASSLPATELANDCYCSMFYGCSNLTSAPALPAETLVYRCYGNMFKNCTKLTSAPELPAITLYNRCYYQMFYGCSALKYIKCLAVDISATDCTTNWVNGVASSGTFVSNSLMSSWTTGNNGIPNGWTTQSYVVPNKYTVTFIDWDETILKTERVVEGTDAHAPTNPTRDGYAFTGWDVNFCNVMSNLTVTAQYEEGDMRQFVILFTNNQDDNEIKRESVNILIPNAPIIAGFTFIGWRTISAMIDDTIEIEAVYQADEPSSVPAIISNPSDSAQKLIREGNVYILKGEKTYTITGQILK